MFYEDQGIYSFSKRMSLGPILKDITMLPVGSMFTKDDPCLLKMIHVQKKTPSAALPSRRQAYTET